VKIMHSAIVVSHEGSLEELNQLLSDGGWWVTQISPGNNGSWLVVLTDKDPDKLFADDFALDESELED
jgi:hypothetical protein